MTQEDRPVLVLGGTGWIGRNVTAAFLGNDGTIPKTIMPDQLHPNAAGYQLWADAMQPLLTEMMK